MGVRGLLDYITRTPASRRKVSLREAAKALQEKCGREPKLLCDYFSTLHWLLSSCDHALINDGRQSPYSMLYGGDLNQYSSDFQGFVGALRGLGVEPIFFIDGPPGSNLEEFQWKFPEWQRRYLQKMKRCSDVLQVCCGYQDFLCVRWMQWEAVSLQVLFALRSAKVQVTYCFGEADSQLLEYHRTHENESLGILSSDTDFAIASGSVLFHTNFFDKELVTLLVSGTCDSPPDLVCEVVTPQSVATSLKITEAQLIDLSIICGNDYTWELNDILLPWASLGLTSSKVMAVAAWLQNRSTPLLENEEMNHVFSQQPCYKLAIEHSYQAYSTDSKHGVLSQSPLARYIHGSVQRGEMSPSFLSILNGIYWKMVVIAPVTLGQPSFNDHTQSLRRCLYAMLGLREVQEYGRTGTELFTKTTIDLGSEFVDTDVAELLQTIRNLSVNDKLAILFHLVASCRSIHFSSQINYLLRRGWDSDDPISSKAVLICSSLHLFQQANGSLYPSPRITPCEIEAILVTCLLLAADIPTCHIPTLPGARIVTVAMWFSHVLEQVYMAASFVGLTDILDPPGSVFYPLACVRFLLVSSAVNKYTVDTQYGPSAAEAFAIFSKVISLKPVLNLRASIINQHHSVNLPDILHLFKSALAEVLARKEMLTPKLSPYLLSHSKLDIGFKTEDRRKDNDAHEATLLCDAPEFQLDTDSSGTTVGNVSDDALCEAVEYNELSHTQEYDISEEYLYLSNQSLCEEETVTKQGRSPREGVGSPELPSTEEKEMGRTVSGQLPIMEHRETVLELVENHQVVFIEGETGCGKSTMIPQFILDQALNSDPPKDCRILITQPRRVAAMKLAERVAKVRSERLGETVGYCIGGERHRSSRTQLTYCTTGYMLQTLIHQPTTIEQYTHIILDEIHERSSNTDFAMLVVRKLVSQMPTTKIIIMSATMQGDLLVQYFEEAFPLGQVALPYFVGAKRYPVQQYFLDQLSVMVDTERKSWHKEQFKAGENLKDLVRTRAEEKMKRAIFAKADISPFAMAVCTEVIVSQASLGESILVFLPGIAEIAKYHETLTKELSERSMAGYFSIFILHSQVPLDDQKEAFCSPPKSNVHIILATNIAESSITLPKLRMVVNFGVYRQMEYNSKRHISCLVKKWCSHASCAQRAGRAGRVFEGVAVHLFTENFYNVVLPEYDPPEMVTASLTQLVLQAKQIGAKVGIPSPSNFLGLAIEPPSLQQMEAALKDLANLGAIASVPGQQISEKAEITLLGHISLSLPVDLVLSRLILMGIFFGSPLEAIIMSASVSLSQDVFSLPSRVVMKDEKVFSSCLWKSMNQRFSYDGGEYSDLLAAVRLFQDWISWRNTELNSSMLRNQDGGGSFSKTTMKRQLRYKSRYLLARRFSQVKHQAIRWERLLHFESLVSEIASRVLIHIPDNIVLYGELRKLAALATHQRPFQCDISSPRSSRKPSNSDSRECNANSFDFEFCYDVDVLKAILAAAFSHQKFIGTKSSECFFKKEKAAAWRALDIMHDRGLDPTRTLYMVGVKKTTAPELQDLVCQVSPFLWSVQTQVVGDSAFIEFNPTFNDNPKTETFHSRIGVSGEATCDDPQLSTPLPLTLHLFWQYGERRPVWHVEGIATEFTKPKHSNAIFWGRLSSEKELVLNNSWRNLTGLISTAESDEGEVFLAVASTVQGLENRSMVSVKGITLLPRLTYGPTAILMALAFDPLMSLVSLCVDPASKAVVAVELSSQVIEFGHNINNHLTGADIVRINSLRTAMSTALSALAPDGTISMDVIEPIPHLLRNMLRRENVVHIDGFVKPSTLPCGLMSTPDISQTSTPRASIPSIEDETGQEDLEVLEQPSTLSPTPASVHDCHWEDSLNSDQRKHDIGSNSEDCLTLGSFQYYPPLQCSLVTASLKHEAKVQQVYTPVLFEPLDVRASTIRKVPCDPPQPCTNDIKINDSDDDEEDYHSSSDSSSGPFKLSPNAKPFVPSNPVPQESQEASGDLSVLEPLSVLWNLHSLSNALKQRTNVEESCEEVSTPFQMYPLDSNSLSMNLAGALSRTPPFRHDYGFAMPSSPAHDYFSPEGNLSCLRCHSSPLQPDLERQRLELPNLTSGQLGSLGENLRRSIQLQHHKDAIAMQPVVISKATDTQRQQAGSMQRMPCVPRRSLESRANSQQQRKASSGGAQWGRITSARTAGQTSAACNPSLQVEVGESYVSIVTRSGIPATGHIPSSHTPHSASCEQSGIPIAEQTHSQGLRMQTSVKAHSPLLPEPLSRVPPPTSLSSPPSVGPRGHPPLIPSYRARNVPAPIRPASVAQRGVPPPLLPKGPVAPARNNHALGHRTGEASIRSTSGLDHQSQMLGGQRFRPIHGTVCRSSTPRLCVQAPPFAHHWPRQPKPVHGRPPPQRPRLPTFTKVQRYSPPLEWVQKMYAMYPHLPPIPDYSTRSLGLPPPPSHAPRIVQAQVNRPPVLPDVCSEATHLAPAISLISSQTTDKGGSKPPDKEQQLVRYCVNYLRKNGGEASISTMSKRLVDLHSLIDDVPSRVAPPGRQFFFRHSDTFGIFGSSSEGFVVRLRERHVDPKAIPNSVANLKEHAQESQTDEEKEGKEMTGRLARTDEEMSGRLAKIDEEKEGKDMSERMAETAEKKDGEEVCESMAEKQDEERTAETKENGDEMSETPEGELEGKERSKSTGGEVSKGIAETEVGKGGEKMDKALEENKDVQSESMPEIGKEETSNVKKLAEKSERVVEIGKEKGEKGKKLSVTKKEGEEKSESMDDPKEEKQGEAQVMAWQVVVCNVKGDENPDHKLDELEGHVMKKPVKDEESEIVSKLGEVDRQEAIQKVVKTQEDIKMKQGSEEGQEVIAVQQYSNEVLAKEGEVEECKEQWDAIPIDTLSDSTVYDEAWDTYSLTEVHISESWSTDDSTSVSSSAVATGKELDTLASCGTSPVLSPYPHQAIIAHAEDQENPPVYLLDLSQPSESSPEQGGSGWPSEGERETSEENQDENILPVSSSPACPEVTAYSGHHKESGSVDSSAHSSKSSACPPISPKLSPAGSSTVTRSATVRLYGKSDREDQMLRFFVRFLRHKKCSVGFVRLCTEYRSAYGRPQSGCWLPKDFFSRWPQLFLVSEGASGTLVCLNPMCKAKDDEVLEQEIVRYLSRNGRMCLLSAVKSDRNIEVLSRETDIELTPHYFQSRPKVFKICPIESFEDLEHDWYVFLQSTAAVHTNLPSGTASKSPPKTKNKSKGRKARLRPQQSYGTGWRREEREREQKRDVTSGQERKLKSAPAGCGQRRRGEATGGKTKPQSAPTGHRRMAKEEQLRTRKDAAGNSLR